VLVTHGLHWLPEVDQVIVMKDGRVHERGSYNDLMARGGHFTELLQNYLSQDEASDDNNEDADGTHRHIIIVALVLGMFAQICNSVVYCYGLRHWTYDCAVVAEIKQQLRKRLESVTDDVIVSDDVVTDDAKPR
jgi:ABC-type dipeptide/oligopeptide/nickel transport system ATPase component